MDANAKLRESLKKAKKIVIKVGTSTLVYPNGNLNLSLINKLSMVLSDLNNQGKDVILVSSGAIGVGSNTMKFKKRPTETREKQAAAAIGQAALMHIYQNNFSEYGKITAQILLTRDDFKPGERKTNTTNTIKTLLEYGVIPIINANDTISTAELGFSDNDTLSASVAVLIKADLLILLTDIDALYDKNPKTNKKAKRIPYVEKASDDVADVKGGKGSEFSVGGMETKLAAAKECYKAGVIMAIADGSRPQNVSDIIDGVDIGTVFDKAHKKATKKG